jgi:hypothetical protein
MQQRARERHSSLRLIAELLKTSNTCQSQALAHLMSATPMPAMIDTSLAVGSCTQCTLAALKAGSAAPTQLAEPTPCAGQAMHVQAAARHLHCTNAGPLLRVTVGCLRSVQPSFFRLWSPLRPLHAMQAVTMFSQVNLPPFDAGLTWSSVRSVLAPQYLHIDKIDGHVNVPCCDHERQWLHLPPTALIGPGATSSDT